MPTSQAALLLMLRTATLTSHPLEEQPPMSGRYSLPAVAFVAVACLALATPSPAATPLDTPATSLVESAQSFLSVNVTAGASGAPVGFTIEWMPKADYDAYGWPTDYSVPGYAWCTFDGHPTFNMTPGVPTYTLAPGQTIRVVLGELFDETGVSTNYLGEMGAADQYVIRIHAEGDLTHDPSSNSANSVLATSPQSQCTGTPGYWKNHPELWPVTSLQLGQVTYTKTQLLQILGNPANGNGLVSLAHVLIAAKLNVANGANSATILNTIADADALIGTRVVPPIGSGSLDPSVTENDTQTLDQFDNGKDKTTTCGATTPNRPTTWGNVRNLYH